MIINDNLIETRHNLFAHIKQILLPFDYKSSGEDEKHFLLDCLL